MINGVLVDVEPDAIRLVATDRYRLAVAEVPARVTDRAAGTCCRPVSSTGSHRCWPKRARRRSRCCWPTAG